MSDDRSIDLALLDEVRERVHGQAHPTPLELAQQAAGESDPTSRARTLVQLARRLRAHGYDDLALMAADAAVQAAGAADAARAAQITMVSIHADAGRLAVAAELGERLLETGSEPPLVRAMAHVTWGLFLETDDERHRQRWRTLSSQLERVQAA